MKKYIVFLVFFVFINISIYSQTILTAGDIAFVGFNSDEAEDSFCIVLLTNISANTQIRFTDIGWYDAIPGFGATGEDEFVWTATSSMNIGDYVVFWKTGIAFPFVPNASVGSVSGNGLSLTIAGDQVIAYQGTPSSPTFISGIHMNAGVNYNGTNWDNGEGQITTTSDLPPGLSNGVNAISINPEVDNARYNGPAGGSVSTMRANINDQSNWETDNTTSYSLPPSVALPVELTTFYAYKSSNKIDLIWQTATEVNNYGFEIERASVISGIIVKKCC